MIEISKWEVIRFDKGRSTSIHIAYYDNELIAQTIADAMNALDEKEVYGRTVVLEPQWYVQPLPITSPVTHSCEKCDQLV